MTTRRGSGDGGAVIVEAALVLPLLFALIMGLIEFATTELDQSQASSAARDGARVGILSYRDADVVGSGDRNDIVAAVNERLTGQQGVTVQVRCTTGAGATIACASVDPQEGYLEVTASWPSTEKTLWGFLIPETISGTSRMALVGAPVNVSVTTSTTAPSQTTTTSAPPASTTTTTILPPNCTVTSNPVITGAQAKSNGQLAVDTTIGGIRLSGSECANPKLRVYFAGGGTAGPSITVNLGVSAGVYSHTWSRNTTPAGSQTNWATGVIQFEILTNSGAVINTYSFTMGSG